MATRDPRDIVTPHAFDVAPDLLGRPLAGPGRRAGAMAVDGLLVALLSNAPSVLFGLAAALVLFRVSAKSAKGGYLRRSVRFAFRSFAAFVLFLVVVSWWGNLSKRAVRPPPDIPAVVTGIEDGVLGADMRSTARSRAARAARTSGLPAADLQAADSLVLQYGQALSAGDTVVPALRSQLMHSLAADTLAALYREMDRLEARSARLATELSTARESRGILDFLQTLARDMGLGIGWAALYFTAFLVLWSGQTPGKRVFRTRVVRLGGEPMTWWAAFGRFGGYAAGFATGLLGFLQILWDANRQAVHDKIAQTVVIQE